MKIKQNCSYCKKGNCGLCVDVSCLCRKEHSKRELVDSFTQTARNVLPGSPAALKQILQNDISESNVYDDSIPEEIINEGISKSIDRYFDVIGSGECVSLNEDGYTLPGNGGFYESCMKLGIKGCIGSSSDYEDEQSNHMQEERRRIHNDFDLKCNEGRKIVSGQKIRMACRRLSCSKCYRKTIPQAAQKASMRMISFIAYLDSHFGIQEKRQFNHSVSSIPKSMYKDMRDPQKRKKIERKMLSELKLIGTLDDKKNGIKGDKMRNGIRGGLMVYHPFRFHKGLTEPYFSPHYHFILAGWTTPEGVIQFHKRTGGITYTAFGSFGDTKRLFNSICYILSHCGILKDKHSVRYFGKCHNRHFKTGDISSHAPDSIDEIVDFVESIVNPNLNNVKADLQTSFKKSTLKSLKVQEVIFGNFTVSDIEKRRVIDIGTDEAKLKTKISELCLDESVLQYGVNDLDNAPKTKSDLESAAADLRCILVSAEHDIEKMKFSLKTNSYYKEKCYNKSSVFILIVNDSTVDLCAICKFKMKKLISVDDSVDISKIFLVSPELDTVNPVLKVGQVPDNQSFLANGSDFRYLDFTDYNNGIPYFDELSTGSIVLKRDNKILHPIEFYDNYSEQSKLQFIELQDKSKKKAIDRYCKNLIFSGNSTESFEDLVSRCGIVDYNVTLKPKKLLKSKKMITQSQKITSFVS